MRPVALLLATTLLSGVLLCLSPTAAQDRLIPAPLRTFIPFESAWDGMHRVLAARNLAVTRQDRARGFIVTAFQDYISGPLTESHIAKVGVKPKLPDGEWVRAKYRFQILTELVDAKETLVTVNADVQALKREFLGSESWVLIPTSGKLEEELLSEFGREMFGPNFQLAVPKKGFWQRAPEYVPDMEERIPKVVGPERP